MPFYAFSHVGHRPAVGAHFGSWHGAVDKDNPRHAQSHLITDPSPTARSFSTQKYRPPCFQSPCYRNSEAWCPFAESKGAFEENGVLTLPAMVKEDASALFFKSTPKATPPSPAVHELSLSRVPKPPEQTGHRTISRAGFFPRGVSQTWSVKPQECVHSQVTGITQFHVRCYRMTRSQS